MRELAGQAATGITEAASAVDADGATTPPASTPVQSALPSNRAWHSKGGVSRRALLTPPVTDAALPPLPDVASCLMGDPTSICAKHVLLLALDEESKLGMALASSLLPSPPSVGDCGDTATVAE
jgi:hypothetical protein